LWASEHFGLVPDIMTSAKGIASGMPLGATIARAELMNWGPGAHASTFGGNPVCIASALATLDLIEESLLENSRRMGELLMARMREWPGRFRHVGEVRGRGLMMGIELVRDGESKERAPELRDRLSDMAFERGLLVLGAGPNSIRLSPPLIVTADQCQFALDTLESCLAATE
jgi:4-aminobutyrate aminotransferase